MKKIGLFLVMLILISMVSFVYAEELCTDSDGGKDYYVKGTVSWNDTIYEDVCGDYDSNYLKEYVCKTNTEGELMAMYFGYNCVKGCENGACVKVTPNEETGPINLPEEYEGEIELCNGCVLNNKCYPFGYRKSDKYCSESLEFEEQQEADISCDNNFECESNVCVSGECVSVGLIKKIINWFKRLFS